MDANGSLWSIFSRALSTNDLVRLQLVVVGSGIGASIYLLQAWRRRSVLTTISANIFILMWIGACFADAVLFPAGRLVVIAIAAIPIGIGLVVTFSLLSRRSQVIVVCTGALVLTIPESLENFMPSLFTKYIPETAISINPSNQWDKAGLLAKLPQMNMLPAYFSIGDNYVLIIEGHQLPIVFQEID